MICGAQMTLLSQPRISGEQRWRTHGVGSSPTLDGVGGTMWCGLESRLRGDLVDLEGNSFKSLRGIYVNANESAGRT